MLNDDSVYCAYLPESWWRCVQVTVAEPSAASRCIQVIRLSWSSSGKSYRTARPGRGWTGCQHSAPVECWTAASQAPSLAGNSSAYIHSLIHVLYSKILTDGNYLQKYKFLKSDWFRLISNNSGSQYSIRKTTETAKVNYKFDNVSYVKDIYFIYSFIYLFAQRTHGKLNIAVI